MRLLGALGCVLGALVVCRLWRRPEGCLHTVNSRAKMVFVNTHTTNRFALVPVDQLDDLLELARLAADRLPETDPLVTALRGSAAAVRSLAVLEP